MRTPFDDKDLKQSLKKPKEEKKAPKWEKNAQTEA